MVNSVERDLPLKRGTAHYIVSEAQDQYLCREEVTMKKDSGIYPAGMVLGRVTAVGEHSGKFAPYNANATDGTQVAVAILYQDVDTTGKDVKRTITARLTEVQRSALSFAGTPTDAQKLAAYTSLATNHIVMR